MATSPRLIIQAEEVSKLLNVNDIMTRNMSTFTYDMELESALSCVEIWAVL